MDNLESIRSLLVRYDNFPKPGVCFVDIFPILRDPAAFEFIISHFVHHITSDTLPKHGREKVDVVVGLDARGFLFGPIIALRLGAAFVPIRKVGKLPGPCSEVSYTKEYGSDKVEMQRDAIREGQTVIIVDDLIATGGSAEASSELVKKQGGIVLEYLFVIEVLMQRKWNNDAEIFSIYKFS